MIEQTKDIQNTHTHTNFKATKFKEEKNEEILNLREIKKKLKLNFELEK